MWPYLIICGVVWLGGYNVALNEAERRVDAGTAAMLVGIGPLLIPLLAGLVLKERLPARLLGGIAIAFAGAVIIGASSTTGVSADVWGVVLSIVAAVAYAIGVVTQKPLLAEMSALRVTWLACTIGLIVCLPFTPALIHDLSAAGAASIWWMIYLGAFPTALAFTTWAYALGRTSAGRLGATTYLVPPIAVLMGWLLLGESPPCWPSPAAPCASSACTWPAGHHAEQDRAHPGKTGLTRARRGSAGQDRRVQPSRASQGRYSWPSGGSRRSSARRSHWAAAVAASMTSDG